MPSKWSSGVHRCSASVAANKMVPLSAVRHWRAWASMPSAMSVASTKPVGPRRGAMARASSPGPLATSSQCSPGAGAAATMSASCRLARRCAALS